MFGGKKGFTLIELLVVVAIVSLVSSVILSSLNSARAKVRDSKRVADLRSMRTALELYFNNYGRYPIVSFWATSEVTSYDNGTRWQALQTALSPFMSKLPNDPKGTGNYGPWSDNNYHYAYGSSSGSKYDLIAQLEVTTSLMCSTKGWLYHNGEGSYPPETTWCGSWSSKMYADH